MIDLTRLILTIAAEDPVTARGLAIRYNDLIDEIKATAAACCAETTFRQARARVEKGVSDGR